MGSLTVLALFLSYTMLGVCDLSTDGCFTLGAVTGAVAALAGHPYLSLPAAMCAGVLSGLVTATLQTRMGIDSLLSGIIVNTGLYSINIAIMGGAKLADKLGLIGSFMGKCDTILVLGGMAYTFFKAEGAEIGESIYDGKSLDLVRDLIKEAEAKGTRLCLPVDTVVANKFSNDAEFTVVDSHSIPEEFMGMDIGPKTVEIYSEIIKGAKTIVWNGPA
ncbi:MAG: phosphoglycerate kinase, partial [Oscillospiraceae bacterium]|nr:phosphoglycerate kinase [Oscillospiraceae bacterium]